MIVVIIKDMEGYGYSVWLVMSQDKILTRYLTTYNDHVFTPHVTLRSNYTLEEAKDYLISLDTLVGKVSFKDSVPISKQKYCVHELPRGEYNNDPLYGWGMVVDLKGFKVDHTPHLTIHYSEKPLKKVPVLCLRKRTFTVVACIADTRSLKPHKWKIIF